MTTAAVPGAAKGTGQTVETRDAQTGGGTSAASIARLEERVFSLAAKLDQVTAAHEQAHAIDRAASERARTELNTRLLEANGVRDEMREQLLRFAPREQLASETHRLEGICDRLDTEMDRRTAVNAERILIIERAITVLQGITGELAAVVVDVRELREWRSNAAGRNQVFAVASSAVVSILVGIVVFALTKG